MSATGQEVEVPHEYVKPATGMLAGRPGTQIAAADDAITVASPTTVVSVPVRTVACCDFILILFLKGASSLDTDGRCFIRPVHPVSVRGRERCGLYVYTHTHTSPYMKTHTHTHTHTFTLSKFMLTC